MGSKIEIQPGDTYGRLTVIREVSPIISGKQSQRCVECRCDCGVLKVYRLYALRNGNTTSCGCLAKELVSSRMRTHGKSSVAEYGIWRGMVSRCREIESGGHRHYGGRGIRVCDRWVNSFDAFYEDMGSRPSPDHSIDRIDNDGDYEPGNCRWATQKEQSRNKRVNYLVEHEGEVRCVADWAEKYGVSATLLYNRLVKLGWTFEEAISRRVHVKRSTDAFYLTPMKDRDAGWQREHESREQIRIAEDRREFALYGDRLARTHLLDPEEFKARVDAILVEGWQRKNAINRALFEMGAID